MLAPYPEPAYELQATHDAWQGALAINRRLRKALYASLAFQGLLSVLFYVLVSRSM